MDLNIKRISKRVNFVSSGVYLKGSLYLQKFKFRWNFRYFRN